MPRHPEKPDGGKGPREAPETPGTDDEPICRVCRDASGPLVRPCRCSGSMQYVHQHCLEVWLRYSRTSRCKICGYEFRFSDVYRDDAAAELSAWQVGARAAAAAATLARRVTAVAVWVIAVPAAAAWAWRFFFDFSRAFEAALWAARQPLRTWAHVPSREALVAWAYSDLLLGGGVAAAVLVVTVGLMVVREFVLLHTPHDAHGRPAVAPVGLVAGDESDPDEIADVDDGRAALAQATAFAFEAETVPFDLSVECGTEPVIYRAPSQSPSDGNVSTRVYTAEVPGRLPAGLVQPPLKISTPEELLATLELLDRVNQPTAVTWVYMMRAAPQPVPQVPEGDDAEMPAGAQNNNVNALVEMAGLNHPLATVLRNAATVLFVLTAFLGLGAWLPKVTGASLWLVGSWIRARVDSSYAPTQALPGLAVQLALGYAVGLCAGAMAVRWLDILSHPYLVTLARLIHEWTRSSTHLPKLALLFLVEMLAIPIGCALVLALALGPAATAVPMETVWKSLVAGHLPAWWQEQGQIRSFLASRAVLWLVGAHVMFQLTNLLALLRSCMREGALWFVRDPGDPNFEPMAEMTSKPLLLQMRKLGIGTLVYAVVGIIACAQFVAMGYVLEVAGALLQALMPLPRAWVRSAFRVWPLNMRLHAADAWTLVFPVDALLVYIVFVNIVEHPLLEMAVRHVFLDLLYVGSGILQLRNLFFPDNDDGFEDVEEEDEDEDAYEDVDTATSSHLDSPNARTRKGERELGWTAFRVPNSDNVREPVPPTETMLVPLRVGDPLAGRARQSASEVEAHWTAVLMPPRWRTRCAVWLLVVVVGAIAVVGGGALVALPLIVGRLAGLLLRAVLPTRSFAAAALRGTPFVTPAVVPFGNETEGATAVLWRTLPAARGDLPLNDVHAYVLGAGIVAGSVLAYVRLRDHAYRMRFAHRRLHAFEDDLAAGASQWRRLGAVSHRGRSRRRSQWWSRLRLRAKIVLGITRAWLGIHTLWLVEPTREWLYGPWRFEPHVMAGRHRRVITPVVRARWAAQVALLLFLAMAVVPLLLGTALNLYIVNPALQHVLSSETAARWRFLELPLRPSGAVVLWDVLAAGPLWQNLCVGWVWQRLFYVVSDSYDGAFPGLAVSAVEEFRVNSWSSVPLPVCIRAAWRFAAVLLALVMAPAAAVAASAGLLGFEGSAAVQAVYPLFLAALGGTAVAVLAVRAWAAFAARVRAQERFIGRVLHEYSAG